MGWTGHAAIMEESRETYHISVGKSEAKTPLGRTRSRWENNIEMDFQEVGSGVWTGVTWLRIGTGNGHL